MTTYNISSYDPDWTDLVSTPPSSGTIKLVNNLGSAGSPLTTLNPLTIPSGVTFDGQGYVIYINITNFEGILELTGGTIQNVGVIVVGGTLATNNAYIVAGTTHSGYVYNCFTNGILGNSHCGGIVGRTLSAGTLVIERCTYAGNIGVNAFLCGGIKGPIEHVDADIEIKECYSTCDITNTLEKSSGICGSIQSSLKCHIINCYHVGTIITSDFVDNCNIVSLFNSAIAPNNPDIMIKNCYGLDQITYAQNAIEAGMILVQNTVGAAIIRDNGGQDFGNDLSANLKTGSTGNSEDLTTIQGTIPTAWESEPNTWLAGSGSDYPILEQFTLGPWTNYTQYDDDATLTGGYTGENTRGSSGGAGGDPHIAPLLGRPYMLPNDDKTYLLLDNMVDDDRLVIKGSCWHIPRYMYMKEIKKHVKDISDYHIYIDCFKDYTFFKYLKIEYNGREFIFDMDSLIMKKYTNEIDFKRGELPSVKRYKKCKNINISKILTNEERSLKQLGRRSFYRNTEHAKSREIKITTKTNNVKLYIVSDLVKIDERNSMEIIINNNVESFKGSLIRDTVDEVGF